MVRHPRGRLRLTAPIAQLATRYAWRPHLPRSRKPIVTSPWTFILSDNIADFAEEGLDMAIRVGRVGSENLVARHIGETTLMVAAAPEYLARAGTRRTGGHCPPRMPYLRVRLERQSGSV